MAEFHPKDDGGEWEVAKGRHGRRNKSKEKIKNDHKSSGSSSKRMGSHPVPRYYESNNFTELLRQQPDELSKTLLREIKQFQATINNPEICSRNMSLIMKILHKVTRGLFTESDISDTVLVLNEVFNDQSHKFQQQLKSYVAKDILKKPINKESVEILCTTFEMLLTKIPNMTWRLLPIDELSKTIQLLESQGMLSTSSNFQMKCDSMFQLRENMKEELTKMALQKSQMRVCGNGEWDNGEYREISVMPQWQELCDPNQERKLRPNLVYEKYEDWMHYYDVQFRLLREDFLSPLCKGIKEYREGKRGKELSNIRLYDEVRLVKSGCMDVGVCHEVKFKSPYKNYSWEHSKRLIFGSLVILSSDDFHHNALFGIVCGGDRSKCKLQVKFERCAEAVVHQKMYTEFKMAESSAYFEAARHILQSLKLADPHTMPFKKYLIRCENDSIDPPKYLDSSLVQMKYNMKFIVSKDVLSMPQNARRFLQVNIRDIRQWPPHSDCELDESQWKAMKEALTKELVVIQGPPGTGKTFIGLKITQALLNNSAAWESRKWSGAGSGKYSEGSPILVLCYTNFALDQFLEGILDLNKGKEIIRVGSRSKSEKLQKCNIALARKRNYKRVPIEDRENIDALAEDAKQISEECKREINKHRSLKMRFISLSDIQHVISEHHYQSLLENAASLEEQDYALELWLGLRIIVPESEANEGIHFDQVFENATTDDILRKEECTDSESDSELSDLSETEGNNYSTESLNSSEELYGDPSLLDDMDIFEDLPVQMQMPKQKKEKKKRRAHKTRRTTKIVKDDKYDETLELIESHLTGTCVDRHFEEIEDVHKLSFKDRMTLYQYWHSLYKNHVLGDLTDLCQRYNRACDRYQESRLAIDRFTLETAHVIGMTTTCAARYQKVLRTVMPRIVIVEEAAEVLESHIVSALSTGTHHLILIGDHKQLRPKPNEYDLVVKYNLDISLFERLVKNSFPHVTLGNQHRMRPEIAELVRPHIYDSLNDHESVRNYPKVKGISKNLFLVCHTEQEKQSRDLSHENEHEANFILSLCRFLLQQGYKPSEITVLVTYSGQLLRMKNEIKSKFQGVRLCTVDDFQGEENDIILLSLVRSNKDGIIGFLKEENRVCVALSRAKHGFYCIGNFDMLRKKSPIWQKIVTKMELNDQVGEGLPFHCNNHPTKIYYAKLPDDFQRYLPNGCCKLVCSAPLICGHKCAKPCHLNDRDHSNYSCLQPCTRTCNEGHVRQSRCSEEDKCMIAIEKMLPCSHTQKVHCHQDPKNVPCYTGVTRIIPSCEHSQEMWCHENPYHFKCNYLDTKILPCGHSQEVPCFKNPLEVKCLVLVPKLLQCNHTQYVPCYQHVRYLVCNALCEETCINDHPCDEICHFGKPCPKCRTAVIKALPKCGHHQSMACHANPYKVQCTSLCSKPCKYNHPCQMKCHAGSNCPGCNIKVEVTPECGHKSIVKCSAREAHSCYTPVNKHLPCGHDVQTHCCTEVGNIVCKTKVNKTIQKCGHSHEVLCSRDVDKIVCQAMVPLPLDCGHVVEIQCSTERKSAICKEPVERTLKCGHKLKLACSVDHNSVICTKVCAKPLGCGHVLKTPCHMEVSKLDCEVACLKKLPCGHKKMDKCNKNISDIVCDKMCGQELECGHECMEICSAKCKCSVNISALLPLCGHSVTIMCSESRKLSKIKCMSPCNKKLPCGHACKKKCSEPCTQLCKETVMVNCRQGHQQKKMCYAEPQPCREKCSRKLNCGHPCKNLCYKECISTCKYLVTKKYPCGHEHRIPCDIPIEKMPCDLICKFPLACGHLCQGICSNCTSSRLHKPCSSSTTVKQFWGGKVRISCSKSQTTQYKFDDGKINAQSIQCKHGNTVWNGLHAALACSEPCQWSCSLKCSHKKSCSRSCSEVCDRSPCEEQCPEFLECGHNCVGVCGEPCIKVCPQCRPEEFESLLQGSDAFSKGKKYIQLPCNHIFTSVFMDQHVALRLNTEISPLQCPTCSILLSFSYRYGNQMKEALSHVAGVWDEMETKGLRDTRDKLFQIYRKVGKTAAQCLVDCLPIVGSKLQEVNKSADMFLLFLFAEFCSAATLLSPFENAQRTISNLSSGVRHCVKVNKPLSYQSVCDLLSEYYRLHLIIKVSISRMSGLNVEDHQRYLDYLDNNPNARVSHNEFIEHSNLLDYKNVGQHCKSTDEIMGGVEIFHPVFKYGLWSRCRRGHYYSCPVMKPDCKCIQVECHQCTGSYAQSLKLCTERTTETPVLDISGQRDKALKEDLAIARARRGSEHTASSKRRKKKERKKRQNKA